MKINIFADGADKKGILDMYQNHQILNIDTNIPLWLKSPKYDVYINPNLSFHVSHV